MKKSGATNSAFMKVSNRRLILNIIRKKPVSRAELSRLTGLTRAAVTIIIDELIKEGILQETGAAEAAFGRKPILLDLNPDRFYAVGVSIARQGCHIGVLNMKGELLAKRSVKLEAGSDAGAGIEKIAEIRIEKNAEANIEKNAEVSIEKNAETCLEMIAGDIKSILNELKLPGERLLGIGVNAPGPIDIGTGTILTPPNFDKWHNISVVRELKKSLETNIYLENNSAALALAEQSYGRGAQFNSFMLMVVDTGIGAGIVINDHLYRGVNGFGSEVGHNSVDINGKPCSCGNKGCLEMYAAIPSVLEDIRRLGGNAASWKEVIDRAESGDELSLRAVENEAMFLSAGIVNIMNVLELEAVILTGDIIYRPEILLNKILSIVDNTAITRHSHKLQIINSSIAENSEVISAAAIIIDKFFKGELENEG